MDVTPVAQDYLQSAKHLAETTHTIYELRLLTFADYCRDHAIQLEQIGARVVGDFVDHLYSTHLPCHHEKTRISTHTAVGYVLVVKAFLSWCLEEETYAAVLNESAVRRIKLPRQDKFVIKIFSDDQLQSLFDACKHELDAHLQLRSRTMLALLLDTGIRAAELCGLTREHVHLDPADPYILVMGKGSKEREVGLGRLSRETLQQYVTAYRADAKPTEPVFLDRYQVEPFSTNNLHHLICRLNERAKIQGVRVSPHTFRHTYAVRFLLAGGDIFKLSLLMGHADIRITEHYLKTMQAHQVRRTVASVLDEMKIN